MLRTLSIGATAVMMILSAGCGDKKSTAPPSYTTSDRKTHSRADFEKLVVGKSQKEVLASLGEPDYKKPPSEKGERWMYVRITTNPNDNSTDETTTLNFEGSKVATVTYAKLGEE